ncbi:MAG: branched-chain amino acid aminotransferase [Planctomycetes bacterium DG_23]|nr:MAG: branched-chain amino acid aminotransferase [Planctomycetes bacterium DG_23]
MGLKVYIDGTLYENDQAKVSVFDHGLLYGDGVFEGIRAYGGRIFQLDAHLERLYDSAKAIALKIPLSPEKLKEAIRNTLDTNGLKDAYIRVVVTRGVGTLGLDPNKCSGSSLIIITDSITLYPDELYEKGLEIVTVATIRIHPAALSPRIKSLNYLNNILAKIEAINAGCLEALMLNANGLVAECTGDNIFIVRKGVIFTPPETAGILKGITRGVVMGLAREEGIEVREENLTRYDLYTADECFLTGTAAEIIPVVRIDRRQIGPGTPGPITSRLRKLFNELTEKEE